MSPWKRHFSGTIRLGLFWKEKKTWNHPSPQEKKRPEGSRNPSGLFLSSLSDGFVSGFFSGKLCPGASPEAFFLLYGLQRSANALHIHDVDAADDGAAVFQAEWGGRGQYALVDDRYDGKGRSGRGAADLPGLRDYRAGIDLKWGSGWCHSYGHTRRKAGWHGCEINITEVPVYSHKYDKKMVV